VIQLTAGELDVMRKVFDHRRWPHAQITVTPAGQKMMADKLYELSVKTRWPGTKSFDHEAAYHVELLERVKQKMDLALDSPVPQ
jgi:hypothetical protein